MPSRSFVSRVRRRRRAPLPDPAWAAAFTPRAPAAHPALPRGGGTALAQRAAGSRQARRRGTPASRPPAEPLAPLPSERVPLRVSLFSLSESADRHRCQNRTRSSVALVAGRPVPGSAQRNGSVPETPASPWNSRKRALLRSFLGNRGLFLYN